MCTFIRHYDYMLSYFDIPNSIPKGPDTILANALQRRLTDIIDKSLDPKYIKIRVREYRNTIVSHFFQPSENIARTNTAD